MVYDAVILGGGPAGYETALWVSSRGGKAAVIESGELGGVCTNRGCIPTKTLGATCDIIEQIAKAKRYGIDVQTQGLNADELFRRRDRVALTMRKGVEKLLQDAKVDVMRGVGKVESETEVTVNNDTVEGRTLVIATGSKPVGLPNVELDHEFVVSGDDAAASSKLPKKVVVVGAGFIGCEYASIYSRLGCGVTLVEALPKILPLEDEDVSDALFEAFSKTMKVVTNAKVESVDREKKAVNVSGEWIQADMVVLATGRVPVIPRGLDEINVLHDKKGVKVDSMMRTSVDNIYAVGDVTALPKLAHAAYAGAEAAGRNIMGDKFEADFIGIPWCIFTSPEIGRAGFTEPEAREAGREVRVGRGDYMANGKARCMGERIGFCKVVVDGRTDEVVGVHIFGAHASDLIGEAALAVRMRLKAQDIAKTIHPHPTLSEVFKEACEKATG